MFKYILSGFMVLWGYQAVSQQTIGDARGMVEQEITVSGMVTSGAELGRIRYFQDATAGLAAYGELAGDLKRGDSITITGTLKNYYELLEIDPIKSVNIYSSGNNLPEPKVLEIGEIGEEYESQLVRINNVQFVNPSGTFGEDTNYSLTDGDKTFEIRINRAAEAIVGQPIPAGNIDLAGICSQYSQQEATTGYQLLPRDMDDIILNDPVNIISPVAVQDISKNGFTLSWKTDVETTPEVVYGTSPDPSVWRDKASGSSTPSDDGFVQEVSISGLAPGEVVYARAYSWFSADTAFAPAAAYATESNSTGDIKVYFNSDVDTSYATHTIAQNIAGAMDDTLVAYIDRAAESVDFCIYNISNSGLTSISEALNRAHQRGVKVRFISCGTTPHLGTDELDADIPFLEGPEETARDGIMHNKFAVIDAESADAEKPVVWTGSANISYNQLVSDANNMVFVQDQSLARSYQIEFEEMWGGSGELPNKANAKFGADKTDNTPHEFVIGGNRVELYFSPSDKTNQQIINNIRLADNNLNIATMLITRTDLALAISEASEMGVATNVLTDENESNTETVNAILDEALGSSGFVFDHLSDGMMHHKYAVIDNGKPEFDPLVITGSHNWSNSANTVNDENTLIIHCEDVANQYYQNFAARFHANNGELITYAINREQPEIVVYPNPASRQVTVSANNVISRLRIFSAGGIKLAEIPGENSHSLKADIGKLTPGLYFLKIDLNPGGEKTFKLIKK